MSEPTVGRSWQQKHALTEQVIGPFGIIFRALIELGGLGVPEAHHSNPAGSALSNSNSWEKGLTYAPCLMRRPPVYPTPVDLRLARRAPPLPCVALAALKATFPTSTCILCILYLGCLALPFGVPALRALPLSPALPPGVLTSLR